MAGNIRRATGSPIKNIVCKYCAHSKSWHRGETFCLVDECDCEAWDYGTNVVEVIPLPDEETPNG